MRVLLYCTSIKNFSLQNYVELFRKSNGKIDDYSQKIVCEVEIDKVDQIWYMQYEEDNRYDCLFFTEEELCLKSCLDHYKLHDYLKGNNGYALHLKNLKVFDRPKELSNYYHFKIIPNGKLSFEALTTAPQNMFTCCDKFGNQYVLISIQPHHLCRILNGDKTIEVRRKIISPLKNLMED